MVIKDYQKYSILFGRFEEAEMKIVVLGGGISTERHVSLVTGTSVCKALRSVGHKAIFVDMFLGLENYTGRIEDIFDTDDGLCGNVSIMKEAPDLEEVKRGRKLTSPSRLGDRVLEVCSMADCVFLGLHGADGEDGKIQAALDLLGIPYTGSSCLGSAIAMDKAVAKKIMNSAGILTPPWEEITYDRDDIGALCERISLPCAVKIVGGGSSIGVALPETKNELWTAFSEILRYGNRVIVEKKISGRELTVPVLDGRALSPIEIIPPDGSSFDYVAKYQSGEEGAREICPADLTQKEKELLGKTAVRLHEALGLSVYSRTDFILDDSGNAWCLEINTLPGMTPNSLIPKAAAVEGISYPELCETIIRLSLKARNLN